MKLVTKLKSFGVFASVLILALGIEVYWNFHQVDLALEKESIASGVVKQAFVLNVLTGDYIQTHGERAEMQWRTQLDHLKKSISDYTIESNNERGIVGQLAKEQSTTLTHFLELRDTIQKQEEMSSKNLDQNFTQEFEKSLNNRLSIDTQRIVTLASRLSDIDAQKVTNIRQSSLILFTIITLSLGMLLILAYIFLAQNITKAMSRLIDGTKTLGSGSFNFRFDVKNHDEFGQLSQAFNSMAQRLQELDNAKNDFVLLASHQLRTPLSIINWYAEAMLSQSKGTLSAVQKNYLTKLYEGCKRMVDLSNDILTVSRLELHTFTSIHAPVDIKEIAEKCVKEFKGQIDEKKITFTQKIDRTIAPLESDPNLLTIVFENLLSNSNMYTPAKGKIHLNIEKENAKHILITLSDTGIGIPKEQRDQIFTKFFRTKNGARMYVDGVGLGLYLTKKILEILGGEIWFFSEEDKGTTFSIRLPIDKNMRKIDAPRIMSYNT